MDVAKYVSWRNQIPLYQIPTCISVNACFTHMIAVREGGRVRYVGDAVPRMVYVDYGLVRKAPPELNRAGLGDILSCYTGLFDWKMCIRDRYGGDQRSRGDLLSSFSNSHPFSDLKMSLGDVMIHEPTLSRLPYITLISSGAARLNHVCDSFVKSTACKAPYGPQ